MLDKKSDTVLRLLIEKTQHSYKVLNKNQIVAELPPRLHNDAQEMLEIVAFLKENEYLDVKYQDKDEICLCTTVKAKSYIDGEKNIVHPAHFTTRQFVLLFAGTFVCAFAGALLAVLLGRLF